MPSADAKTLAPQLTFNFAKISTVLPHFLGIRQIEVPLPLCFPSCRDVQQQDFRLHQASQLLHVRKQNGVSFAVVQRDENLFLTSTVKLWSHNSFSLEGAGSKNSRPTRR